MTKGTRSKVTLPGNIQEYLVENTNTNMPETPPPPTTEAQDVKTLLTLMTKTLTAVTESRTANGQHFAKLEECPLKRTSSSLDAWIKEVLLWDESNTGNQQGLNAKKYLKFLDSVYKSEGCTDLKNLVQVEFVENESFDKKGESVIKEIVKKVARFEKAETHLKNVKIIIPNKELAIHLMNRSSMEEQSKQNVCTKTKLDKDVEIYPSMKKYIREMKGKITKNNFEPTSVKSSENRTCYGKQDERRTRENSGSRSRNDESRCEAKVYKQNRPWRKEREGRSISGYRSNRSSSRYRNRSRDSSRRNER